MLALHLLPDICVYNCLQERANAHSLYMETRDVRFIAQSAIHWLNVVFELLTELICKENSRVNG